MTERRKLNIRGPRKIAFAKKSKAETIENSLSILNKSTLFSTNLN